MDLNNLALDIEKNANGVWFTYPGTDIEFLVARAGNADLRRNQYKKLKRDSKKRKTKVRASTATDASLDIELNKDEEEILTNLVTHILKDWKNVEIGGVEKKFSVSVARDILSQEIYRPIYDFIVECAGDEEAFMVEFKEESSKN